MSTLYFANTASFGQANMTALLVGAQTHNAIPFDKTVINVRQGDSFALPQRHTSVQAHLYRKNATIRLTPTKEAILHHWMDIGTPSLTRQHCSELPKTLVTLENCLHVSLNTFLGGFQNRKTCDSPSVPAPTLILYTERLAARI